jgi:hypothetical protein
MTYLRMFLLIAIARCPLSKDAYFEILENKGLLK